MIRYTWILMAAAAFAQSPSEITAARDAVRAAEIEHGPQHPATAMMIRNLALAFAEAGYPDQAAHYAQQALSILESKFGAADVTLVPSLNVLTEACASEGRFTEAARYAARAVAIGPDAGPHYATALYNLAAILERQGKRKEASDYYARALATRQALLPAGHPYIQATQQAMLRVDRAPKPSVKTALR